MDTGRQEGLEPPTPRHPRVNTSDPSLQSLVHFKRWVLGKKKKKQDSFK